MISERARASFDTLLKRAMCEHLSVSPEVPCEVEVIEGIDHIEEEEFVVLTVSSYLFRLVVLFYFTGNEETREHFAKLIRTPAKRLDDKVFYDAVSEFGNLCCGSINRDLGRHFPHVGMSTPNVLRRGSIAFLDTLGAEYIQHFKIDLGTSIRFHATICVCEYGDLDFNAEAKVVEENLGELELF
ncbi:MAG TPA: hypothetical protein VJ486_08760 [Geothrix sp.]|nr:hypothetical protein [Geothrix sp.]